MKTLSIALLAACVLCGCRRTDVRDFTVEIPALTEANKAEIAAALAPYGGVIRESLAFDVAAHRLALKYDSMQLAKKNIEMAIAAAGYTANGVTPASIGKPAKGK